MSRILSSLRALSLALWVGGIFFFAIGLAPVAFRVLPSSHEAGLVVGASLLVLHRLGLLCGVAYLLAVISSPRSSSRQPAAHPLLPAGLVLLMVALTLCSHFVVLPRMERDRALADGDLSQLPPTAPARADFDRLHHRSEQIEGSVLLLGLTALLLDAAPSRRERSEPPKQPPH